MPKFDDPRLRTHARAMLLRQVDAALESGRWSEACKLIGVSPRVALASQRTFKTALADAGVEWHSNPVSRRLAERNEKKSRFLDAEAGDGDLDDESDTGMAKRRQRDAFDAAERGAL